MANIQQVGNTVAGPGTRAGGVHGAVGNFRGVDVRRDVDEVGFEAVVQNAMLKRGINQAAVTKRVPNPLSHFNVRSMTMQELARHAKISGDPQQVNRNSLKFLRQRRLTGQSPGSNAWKAGGLGSGMRQYLGLQKLQVAVKAHEAARRQERSEEEAADEFMAAMAPLADNPGNAAGLAQRFYEALGHDADLEELLSGFDEERRGALREELQSCSIIEEYDTEQKGYRKSLDRREFSSALRRAMQLQDYRLTDGEARELLIDVQGQIAEMESDEEFDRYSTGAINILTVAEELQQQGDDPVKFVGNYHELIHADDSLAGKLEQAASIYVPPEGNIDLPKLRLTMEAASSAANLDMHSARPSTTDKNHLWAAMQSAKLIARLCTAVTLAQTASRFLQRHFGREVNASELLRELLRRMADPRAPASSHIDMARRMKLHDEAMPATLKQAADFFRTMHDMYPDPQMRQTLLQNVTDAMDEAARLEDEHLGNQAGSNDVVTIVEPLQPKIPTAQKGESTWTGSSNR